MDPLTEAEPGHEDSVVLISERKSLADLRVKTTGSLGDVVDIEVSVEAPQREKRKASSAVHLREQNK